MKDAYPLPRIDDSLDALGGAKFFSTLDLASGYWQVMMDKDAREKSAFVTTSGLYAWNVLPFGLCNAPSTFERLMDSVLAGLRWETLLVYLDDVIVFGSTIAKSIERLTCVLDRFRDAGLKLKPSKCHLFQKEVAYLGHVVSREGIHTDPVKIEAVRDWPVPSTQTQVRSFLGLASYYRRFIKGFANVAAPLNKLTEKNTKFVWTEQCTVAFEQLKQALISAPILAYPCADGQFVLDTDASNFAIGCVLSQVQDGEERVVAYGSRSLSKAERNYCVTRRELLAIVEFLKKYRHYVGGSRVKVRTDHGSLRWLFSFKNPEGQLARWLEVLSSFDLDIEYRPGKKHQNADGLSRRPCRQCGRWEGLMVKEKEEQDRVKAELVELVQHDVPAMCDIGIQTQSESDHTVSGDVNVEHVATIETTTKVNQGSLTDDDQKDDGASVGFEISLDSDWMDDCVWEGGEEEVQTEDIQVRNVSNVPEITFEMIRAEQLADKTISPVLSWKESEEERPSWKDMSDKTSTLKCYWSQWDSLCVKEGVLVKRWESDDGKVIKWLVVLPSGLRERVLDELHASNAAAHLGREKTLPKVRERFYWVGMSTDVAAYVRRCVMCARKKNPPRKRRAPLQQYRVGAPMERIAIDVLGPLTETNDGNVFILVVGDYFTKWMESYPIKDQQAETVAEVLVSQFVCRFGVPIDLHSDQGRNFESKVFQEMCTILGINKTRTTPYNPKSDGLVERYNRTIVNAVSLMIQPHQHQRDWDVYLPYVGMAYRSSIQASTGESPNMMMLGREVTMPVDLVVGAVPHEQECETYYADDLREKIRDIHERARHALQLSQRRQKRNYDRSARESVFKKGKFVWLHNNQRRPRLSKKLMLPWEGPYLIVTELSDVTCRIQKTARSKPKVVHVDRLKLYEGPELKGWEYEVTVEKEIDITLDGSAGASKEELQASCDEGRVDEDVRQNPVADVGQEFDKSDKGIVDEDVRQNPEYAGKDSHIVSDKGSVDENVRRNPGRTRKLPARYL